MFVALAAASTVFILVPRGVGAGAVTIQSDHMSWVSPSLPCSLHRMSPIFAVLAAQGVDMPVFHSSSLHVQNTTKGTYQLNLLARIPITNPNFLTVGCWHWTLTSIFFYTGKQSMLLHTHVFYLCSTDAWAWLSQATVEGKLSVYFYDTEAGMQKIKALKVAPRSSPETLEVTVDASNVPNEYALTILSECAAFPRRLIFFLKGALTVGFYTHLVPPNLFRPHFSH